MMDENKYLPYANLFLRLSLAFTLLSAVADRFGFWGEPGTKNVTWGNWFRFQEYTHRLNPYLSRGIADKVAVGITLVEVVFGLMLLFGVKVRWSAVGTGILTLLLSIATSITLGIKVALDQGLVVACAASFLLACTPVYKWTLNGVKKKKVYKPY